MRNGGVLRCTGSSRVGWRSGAGRSADGHAAGARAEQSHGAGRAAHALPGGHVRLLLQPPGVLPAGPQAQAAPAHHERANRPPGDVHAAQGCSLRYALLQLVPLLLSVRCILDSSASYLAFAWLTVWCASLKHAWSHVQMCDHLGSRELRYQVLQSDEC